MPVAVAGDNNSLSIQMHTDREDCFWISLLNMTLDMSHHIITQCLKYMLLYSIETVSDQYLQLILQWYFNGHEVAPLVVAIDFLIISFWLAVNSWRLCLLTM